MYGLGPNGVSGERNTLGILGTGGFADQNWTNPESDYDFFHLKGLMEALLQRLRVRSFQIEPADGCWLAESIEMRQF